MDQQVVFSSQTVLEWLKSIHLEEYFQAFVKKGYDDLEFIKDNGLGEADLDAIGVSKEGHRKKLLMYVKKLDNIEEYKKKGESALRLRSSSMGSSYGSFQTESYDQLPNTDDQFLQIERELASGEFGKVYLARWKQFDLVVAKKLKDMKVQQEDFEKESSLMSKIPFHQNVVRFLGIAKDRQGNKYMVTEFVAGGDVRALMRKHKEDLTEKICVKMLMDIACGMIHLAKCGIIHRDLALRNVLLDESWTAKITDFGLSRQIDQTGEYHSAKRLDSEDAKMPLKHMAPESLLRNMYSEKTDVWSFGVLAFELLTKGEEPYPTLDHVLALRNGTMTPPSYRMQEAGVDPVLVRLFQDCQMRSPEERPSFSLIYEILSDFYYTNEIKVRLNDEISKREELERKVEALERENAEKEQKITELEAKAKLQEGKKSSPTETQKRDKPEKLGTIRRHDASWELPAAFDSSCWMINAKELVTIEKDHKSESIGGKFTILGRNTSAATEKITTKTVRSAHDVQKKKWAKDTVVAVKAYSGLYSDSKMPAQFYKEIETLSHLRHPNIAHFFGISKSEGTTYLVREFVEGMCLQEYMETHIDKLDFDKKMNILISICTGVLYLHKRSFIHGNLKPSNIMLDLSNENHLSVKICDPILVATEELFNRQTQVKIWEYLPPEVHSYNDYVSTDPKKASLITDKIDVWALGVLIWQLCENKLSADGYSKTAYVPNIKSALMKTIGQCREPAAKRPAIADIRDDLMNIQAHPQLYIAANKSFVAVSSGTLEDQSYAVFEKKGTRDAQGLTLSYEDFAIDVVQGILGGANEHGISLEFLLKDPNGQITLEYWKKFVKWFTPLSKPRSHYMTRATSVPDLEAEPASAYTLDFIMEIGNENYFFGFIEAKEAAEVLIKEPHGTYLIRFSSNPKMYALSVSLGNQVAHWRISTTELKINVRFHLENVPFQSLNRLVENFSVGREPLKHTSGPVYLRAPADRWKWKRSLKKR